MAQYSSTPLVSEVGSYPAGWVDVSASNFWEFGGAIGVVASDSGRYAMRISGGSFGGIVEMRWSGAGAPPVFADGEMYVRFRHRTDVASELGLAGRAANNYTSGSFSAYWVRGRASGTSVLARYREINSASVQVESDWATVTSAVGVDCHLMLRMSGSTIDYKIWKEGDSEPAYTTTTDSTLTSAQRLMLFGGNQMNTDIYFIGVGTGADSAPRGGAPASGPVITADPTNQTVASGATAAFSSTYSGSISGYQWQRSTDSGATFGSVPDGTGGSGGAGSGATLTYTTTATAPTTGEHRTGYRYRLRLNPSGTPVDSAAAILTVTPPPGDPSAVTSTPTGGTTATTTWAAGSPAGTGYDIQIETPSGAANWTAAAGTRTGTSFAHTGLAPATSYRARVRATDGLLASARVNGNAFFTDNTGTGGGEIGALVNSGGAGASITISSSGGGTAGGLSSSGGAGASVLITSAGGGTARQIVFVPAIPRLAFRQRTGEMFPLVLDDKNAPIAYKIPGGQTVALRFLDRVKLGAAVSEVSGELIIII